MASDTAETKFREVAQRPARGSLGNFLGDLRDLLRYETLRATIKEFMRDDALGLGAQLFDYLRRLLPAQIFGLIQAYTENTLRNEDTAPGLLSVGILGTIWAA